MKSQCFSPFLSGNEYIPDGEPHIFGDRLYIFGSHDRFGGKRFCMNDYVTYSAPIDDLGNWQYEGVIYRKDQDPENADGKLELWAPDVVHGTDGRYYLYYCLADRPKIGVAVSDLPNGKYEHYGYVQYASGAALGSKASDIKPFDPAVLLDNDGRTWLYSGNGHMGLMSRREQKLNKASIVAEIADDMLTILTEPKKLIPTIRDSLNTGFEGHEFFEASSIRKFNGKYYFIYSSINMHELCYAVSDRPDSGFKYGGVLISNADICPEDNFKVGFNQRASNKAKNYFGNNHGSVCEINGKYFIFYHRHTNRNMYSRQACAAEIQMNPDGHFSQAQMNSLGLNGAPLIGTGKYEARIACQLYSKNGAVISAHPMVQNKSHPAFTQCGTDNEVTAYQFIENMRDGTTAVFKFFDFNGAKQIRVTARGKMSGNFIVRDGENGNTVATILMSKSNEWREFFAPLNIADGKHPLYFTFMGKGALDFLDLTIK